MTRAVVFAYHDVGVRCLKTLLSHGIDVALVVTHRDRADENIWFASVADTAADYGIEVITPDDPDTPEVLDRVRAAHPDLLFSFYYRHLLGTALLDSAPLGAFNMHGSLLPAYRGRVPVNWALIHGETETGATLHAMTSKPDNGAIVDQMAVPILRDDDAADVFAKITVAAEIVLSRSLPALAAGRATLTAQDLSRGGYFGGRRPEDGHLDPVWDAARLHNFIRALTRPFPGAFASLAGRQLRIWRSFRAPFPVGAPRPARASLMAAGGTLWLLAADGQALRLTDAELDDQPLDAAAFHTLFDQQTLELA
ncbi:MULTISPECIES: formyltransferase [Microvirgula]|uniref:formyltransferase n=1 Tax=Microvirgula TaxID=57479 RepID=UPI00048D4745|nr:MULTISPECIES: formyltransferase [Microvirgula]RAS15930.1 methionyl-tRNA formyltransferase [Microvirgula sp. AG722]